MSADNAIRVVRQGNTYFGMMVGGDDVFREGPVEYGTALFWSQSALKIIEVADAYMDGPGNDCTIEYGLVVDQDVIDDHRKEKLKERTATIPGQHTVSFADASLEDQLGYQDGKKVKNGPSGVVTAGNDGTIRAYHTV